MVKMICQNCKHQNQSIATFCSSCGNKLVTEYDYNKSVKSISIFFFTLLAYIAVLHFTNWGSSYISLLVTDSIFAVIVLIFFISDFKKTKSVLKVKKLSNKVLWKALLFSLLAAVCVHLFANMINKSVFDKSEMI